MQRYESLTDSADARVRVLKAEHADIEDRLERAEPVHEAPMTAREIHDIAADASDSERMTDIEDELELLDPASDRLPPR
jgi:hypothetical protein